MNFVRKLIGLFTGLSAALLAPVACASPVEIPVTEDIMPVLVTAPVAETAVAVFALG